MVGEVASVGKLAYSDHNLLVFEAVVYTKDVASGEDRYDYKRGDYDAMRADLRGMDWDEILQGSVHDGWSKFKDVIQRIEKQYVPVRKGGA